MTFSKSRLFSIALVLCVLLSLTVTFASASGESISYDLIYNADSMSYLQQLDSAQFDFFLSAFQSATPLTFSFSDGTSFAADPLSYVDENGPDAYCIYFSLEPVIAVARDHVGGNMIFVYAAYGLSGATLSVTVTADSASGSDPGDGASGDLLSDLRLTGTAFLETVQGVVLSIVQNPLLLLTVGIFFFGGCVAIFACLLSKD